ncbi:TetR/AcrR family transcriptional regulator [Streptomyces sp. NPDC087270]|uniref:TetR/AcrR family transcriptional regulator n=1 Tax=Streptomyces sp. NPDC087270 TaxID=3365774 RepID=UPI0038012408
MDRTRPHGSPQAEAAPRRRDAARNRELLLAAAHAVYAEHGVEAPIDVIARRAGVGNATLYRHFPDRGALVEEVFREALGRIREQGERARTAEDAWAGLCGYLDAVFGMLAADRGANDLMTTGLSGVPSLDALHAHNRETLAALLGRARADGTVRPDATTEDLLLGLLALGRVVPALASVEAGAWRRPLALLLDGLRSRTEADLPGPHLTERQFASVLADFRT